MIVSKSVRNVPIGELHNVHAEYGLDVDVKNEEIVLIETNACPHANVVRLLNGTFVCLKCQDTKTKPFGQMWCRRDKMIVEQCRKDLDFGMPLVIGFLSFLGLSVLYFFVEAVNYITGLANTPDHFFPLGGFCWITFIVMAGFFLYWNYNWHFKVTCILCNEHHYKSEMHQIAGASWLVEKSEVYICRKHKSLTEAR